MSIRVLALYLVIAGLSAYAWKDWFKSLCGLIVLVAVIEHPDMPKTAFGVQGLNPWNVLMTMVLLAWIADRGRQSYVWDMPHHVAVLLLMFLGVIVVGVLRAAFDRSYIEDYPLMSLVSEELINTVKWIVPGLMLFDGCRTRRRVVIAFVCLLIAYFLFAIQVVRNMPLSACFVGGQPLMHARSKLDFEVGYNSTELAVLLAGSCWGLLAALHLARAKCHRALILAATSVVILALALTGGRGGYVAWGATGLVMCFLKWRKHLILAPVVVILLPIIFPGATARMLQGFGQIDASGQTTMDENAVTSDRMVFWPYVIDKIRESPWVGYGRRAVQRTGLQAYLLAKYDDSVAVAHPHNLYLETLIDNGILGSVPELLFLALMGLYSASLFRGTNRLYSAVGGLTLALMLAHLIGGLAGENWYPRENTAGMWTAMFLSLRVYVEEKRAYRDTTATENTWAALNADTASGRVLVSSSIPTSPSGCIRTRP